MVKLNFSDVFFIRNLETNIQDSSYTVWVWINIKKLIPITWMKWIKISQLRKSYELHCYNMNRNGGQTFVVLCTCKVYDRYFVPHCFNCNEFNQFSKNCLNEIYLEKCEKFAGQYITDRCRSTLRLCTILSREQN